MLATRIQSFNAALEQVEPSNFLERIRLFREFRDEIFKLPPDSDEVLDGLKGFLDRRDWKCGEEWVLAAQSNPSRKYVRTLCEILACEDPKAPNENIIELLTELKDPDAVRSLISSIDFRFDFDPNLQIPIKAIKALCEIGNAEAISHVEEIANVQHEILSHEAKRALEAARE